MKKGIGVISILLLFLILAFSLYMRSTTPDKKAIQNIENSGLGSGELQLKNHFESDRGYYVLVYGDDVYDYAVKALTGDLLSIRINDQSRQKLDKELVESGGDRISEEKANAIFEELLNKYFPQADRSNVKLSRSGNHLEEFVYSTTSPMADGTAGPVYIALAFNGYLSGISTVDIEDIEPEVLKGRPDSRQEDAAETDQAGNPAETVKPADETPVTDEKPSTTEQPSATTVIPVDNNKNAA